MESISSINYKINLSRNELCGLINLYIRGRITIMEFWDAQRMLDAKCVVPGGDLTRIPYFKPVQINLEDLIYLKAKSIKHSLNMTGTLPTE